MKQIWTAIFAIPFLFFACHTAVPEQKAYYLDFADSEALYDFYSYREGSPAIIQGHRGTRENGLPENSIAAFEWVLSQMPAVFEIDPRLTKDGVVVVFHDATLDRTTNGTGKVSDYTWAELQQLNLKNAAGEVTEYKIPSFAEVLEWGRGKTAFLLDKKDVPLQMMADIIRLHDANNFVVNLVRSTEDALFYYNDDPHRMFGAAIRKPETFHEYMETGIPPRQIFACTGTEITEYTEELCTLAREKGMRCLISVGPTYDKLPTQEERDAAYRRVVESGATMMESDFPVSAGKALSIVQED